MLRHFGWVLVMLRESCQPRMTQHALVEKLEMLGVLNKHGLPYSRSFIANIETDRSKPSPELLRGFERIFNLPEGAMLRFGLLDYTFRWCETNKISVRRGIDLLESAHRISPFLQKRRGAETTILQRIKQAPGRVTEGVRDRQEDQFVTEGPIRGIMSNFRASKYAFFNGSLCQKACDYRTAQIGHANTPRHDHCKSNITHFEGEQTPCYIATGSPRVTKKESWSDHSLLRAFS